MTSTQEDQGQSKAPTEDVNPAFEQLSQPLLAHEETIVAESTMEDVEEEVVREVRSLISDTLPVGWLDNERRMVYNTNEADWSSNKRRRNGQHQERSCQ